MQTPLEKFSPLLDFIIEKKGKPQQLAKAAEELSELAAQLNKALAQYLSDMAAGTFSDIARPANLNDIYNEIADVQIMLRQVMAILGPTPDIIVTAKLEREAGRVRQQVAKQQAETGQHAADALEYAVSHMIHSGAIHRAIPEAQKEAEKRQILEAVNARTPSDRSATVLAYLPTIEYIECDHCDGFGSVEGGRTILSKCQKCNGLGRVPAHPIPDSCQFWKSACPACATTGYSNISTYRKPKARQQCAACSGLGWLTHSAPAPDSDGKCG